MSNKKQPSATSKSYGHCNVIKYERTLEVKTLSKHRILFMEKLNIFLKKCIYAKTNQKLLYNESKQTYCMELFHISRTYISQQKKKKNGHYRGRDFTKKFCYHKLFMKKEMAPLPNGVTKSMNLMLTKKRQRLQK